MTGSRQSTAVRDDPGGGEALMPGEWSGQPHRQVCQTATRPATVTGHVVADGGCRGEFGANTRRGPVHSPGSPLLPRDSFPIMIPPYRSCSSTIPSLPPRDQPRGTTRPDAPRGTAPQRPVEALRGRPDPGHSARRTRLRLLSRVERSSDRRTAAVRGLLLAGDHPAHRGCADDGLASRRALHVATRALPAGAS